MSVPIELLNGVGTHALPVLAGTAAVAAEVGSSILVKVWEWWTRKTREAERRRELETLASMTGQQVKDAVREIADRLAADQPAAVKSKLEGYLLAVPAQVRRTLRRPSDAAGLTVPPDFVLNRPEDLAPLLPPRPPRFLPGDKVPGTDFELVELLGIGGFGEVWKAKNAFMPGAPLVALKFCLDADAAASLRRETSLLDRIQREGKHPGIVELRHTFLSVDPPFLEYELVEGGDLGGMILDWHRTQGGPSAAQAARVVRRLADVVAFAHAKGIVHRDLKPANILVSGVRSQESGVSQTGGTGSSLTPDSRSLTPSRLKVADFGIGGIASEAAARQARLTLAASTLTAAAAHGSYSLYYASPEQMRGAPADPRDDVHALGVIWYQLLVGDLTAEAPRGAGWKKRQTAKGMTTELIELLEACVASEREDRPADAKEVAERLAFALAEPDGGIELDFTAPAELKKPSPAPPQPVETEPDPFAAIAAAQRAGVTYSPAAVEGALKKSRWLDFVDRLRTIRFGHDRLRWAGGFLCWLLPLAICAGIGAGLGALTQEEILSDSIAHNEALGRDLTVRNRTATMPIQFEGANYYPRFFAYVPSSQSSADPWWGTRRSSQYTISRRSRTDATYSLLEVQPELEAKSRASAEKYVTEVNQALATVTAEYNSQRQGQNAFWYGVLVAVPSGLVLFVGYVVVRWWRVRRLRESQAELIADTRTEYAAELRGMPTQIDLNQPGSVHRLVAALEDSGSAPKPLPNPTWPLHRLFAPF